MSDYRRARAYMVDNQLRTSGITDARVLGRMASVPRELFVAQARRPIAYIDDVQWLGEPRRSRFIAPPAPFAKLLQLAEIGPDDSVLDVGAGNGYSTAVIAGLAGSVVGYEADAALADAAASNLATLGIANASTTSTFGKTQYDVVFVEGALETVPDEFFAALKDGGRLVALVRLGGVFVAHVFVKTATSVAARTEFNATLPPLYAPSGVESFRF